MNATPSPLHEFNGLSKANAHAAKVEKEVLPAFHPNGQDERLYGELRNLAAAYLARQSPGHTLQPTALVHEAYVRLLRRSDLGAISEPAFFATAARAMRSVLVDHARTRSRRKRGGDLSRVPLDDVVDCYEEQAVDLPALDAALMRLADLDPQQALIVELRFFGGLTDDQAAGVLGVSPRTVGRAWRRARAWLHCELEGARDLL